MDQTLGEVPDRIVILADLVLVGVIELDHVVLVIGLALGDERLHHIAGGAGALLGGLHLVTVGVACLEGVGVVLVCHLRDEHLHVIGVNLHVAVGIGHVLRAAPEREVLAGVAHVLEQAAVIAGYADVGVEEDEQLCRNGGLEHADVDGLIQRRVLRGVGLIVAGVTLVEVGKLVAIVGGHELHVLQRGIGALQIPGRAEHHHELFALGARLGKLCVVEVVERLEGVGLAVGIHTLEEVVDVVVGDAAVSGDAFILIAKDLVLEIFVLNAEGVGALAHDHPLGVGGGLHIQNGVGIVIDALREAGDLAVLEVLEFLHALVVHGLRIVHAVIDVLEAAVGGRAVRHEREGVVLGGKIVCVDQLRQIVELVVGNVEVELGSAVECAQLLDIVRHRCDLHACPIGAGVVFFGGQQRITVDVLRQHVPVVLFIARQRHDRGDRGVHGIADEHVQALDQHVGRRAAEDDVILAGGHGRTALDLGTVEIGGDVPLAVVGEFKVKRAGFSVHFVERLLKGCRLGHFAVAGNGCGELHTARNVFCGVQIRDRCGHSAFVRGFLRIADVRRVGGKRRDLRVFAFGGKRRGGQECQNHAENEQKAPKTFFHGFASLICISCTYMCTQL